MIDAVVLLGFGGPRTPQEVRPFLDRVLAGRSVPPQRYEAVVEHYARIGGRSPYNERAQRQADALAGALRARGASLPTYLALQFTEPFVGEVFADLARRGFRHVFAIPLTAYGGAASADRYVAAAAAASSALGASAPRIRYAPPFFDNPLFIQAQVSRIREALPRDAAAVTAILTAHSVPLAAANPYALQVECAAQHVAEAAGLRSWSLAYQSRSGAPSEAWLEPDVLDELRDAARRGVRDVLLVPIGFLCEHVEILYDLDVAAANVARDCGIATRRARAVDDHPAFIRMLADLVEGAQSEAP